MNTLATLARGLEHAAWLLVAAWTAFRLRRAARIAEGRALARHASIAGWIR